MRSLVIGGGQLGQALRRALGDEATIVTGVPWANANDASEHLVDAASRFVSSSGSEPWFVCWSAGVGVVGTPESRLAVERHCLDALLAGLSAAHGFDPSLGSFFLASSAGGIYAEGDGATKTEVSRPHPTSDYGRSKIAQDEAVASWAGRHGVRTLIGRISNLYGPRQDIRKAQGFISHLCRAMAHRTMFTLTTPISTIRDFIYTDDVSARVALWANMGATRPPCAQVKLLVAGRSVTLGRVISMTTAISRTPARVLLAASPSSKEQPASLRFGSLVLPELDRGHPARPLEEGIQSVWTNAMLGLQAERPIG